ncbi:MFS transporter [Gemmiger sp.]|uniref:MFS transporter n=1 Tax=Gemmiger sp. TaxID=2049027 RepID=UPI003F10A62A
MKNIVFLGLISFFMDISAEMVYPIIPLYLVAAFGATPAIVGVIEGIAESTASLLKVFSGYLTDKYKRKKPLAFAGYATGLVYKLALVFASGWPGILFARVIDRLGKGIRTAPRDVLVSESAGDGGMGKAFGVHKALDMAGSALGILLAFLLLRFFGSDSQNYRKIFVISAVPTLLALLMFAFVKEKKEPRAPKQRERFWAKASELDGRLWLYLAVVFLFTLGNSSNSFLLLRAKSAGFDDANVILLYFLYNLTASVLSVPFGKLSDKIGRKQVLTAGYLLFSAVYLGFAFASTPAAFAVIFMLYGVFTAMTAGVERALIAEIAPPRLKGTMLGLHSTIAGVALLPASVICGFLWQNFGSAVPFLFGALMSALAALVLLVFFRTPDRSAAPQS